MNQAAIVLPDNLQDIMEWKADAFMRKQAIVKNYLRGAESYLIVGYLLCQATEDWKKDGSGANNFYEWVEKEVKIKRTNAQRMMDIWKTIGKYLKTHRDLVLSIDFAKLAMLCPVIRKLPEPDVIDWLHAGKENTIRDLEDNIRLHKHGFSQDTCEHLQTEEWSKCLKCHKFFK